MESLSRVENIRPDTFPDIPLYMDQVTTFMDNQLHATKRHEDDKILTKTMINNYAKNNLLPPPEKKKYSKEHLLTLIFIYYFKNVLSISDIQNILNPLTDRYFGKSKNLSLEEIYTRVFQLEEHQVQRIKKSIQEEFLISESAFQDLDNLDEDEADFLQKFTFICLLNFDVYVKKLLIEKIIDSMEKPDAPKGKRKR
jgi:DNA-binding transcriptional MerR regulator